MVMLEEYRVLLCPSLCTIVEIRLFCEVFGINTYRAVCKLSKSQLRNSGDHITTMDT